MEEQPALLTAGLLLTFIAFIIYISFSEFGVMEIITAIERNLAHCYLQQEGKLGEKLYHSTHD